MMAHFDANLGSVWEEGVPAWMPAETPSYTEAQQADIARYQLDLAHQLAHKRKRLLHSLSVGLTAERLAVRYGVDPYLARVSGIFHDWAKADGPEATLAHARELGIDLGVKLELVEPLLHGMIAARVLSERYPELPASVWQAIARHTLGDAHMSPLDMVLFVADGIEPRRPNVEAIVAQREMVASSPLSDLFFTNFSDGMGYVIDTRRYLFPGTLDIYNSIVLARSAGADKEGA